MGDHFMVVESIDWDNKSAIVSLSQYKEKFYIYKPKDGTILFAIRFETKGRLPDALSGKYTSIPAAIEALRVFGLTAKEKHSVKSDRLEKDRKERHAAAANASTGK